MNCEQIREQLVETARGRELSSDLRKIVFAHAAVCGNCAQRLENERSLSLVLGRLAVSRMGAPVRMEQVILKQLQVVPIRRATTKPWMWGAVAAGVALLIVSFASHTGRTNVVPVAKGTAALQRGKSVLVEAHSMTRKRPLLSTRLHAAAHQPSHNSSLESIHAASDDLAGDFTQLPYAPELGLEEQAEMVRVEMTRSALLAMGVPINGDVSDDRIQAEVLLGMDGTARAIRLAD